MHLFVLTETHLLQGIIAVGTEGHSWAGVACSQGRRRLLSQSGLPTHTIQKQESNWSHIEQSGLWSPSKSLAVFQLTLKQVFETQPVLYGGMWKKQPPWLVKPRGTKQCSCVPASPSFPSPFGACNRLHRTLSPIDSCNFLTNLSTTCNFPF